MFLALSVVSVFRLPLGLERLLPHTTVSKTHSSDARFAANALHI